jgi:hypothetical protein
MSDDHLTIASRPAHAGLAEGPVFRRIWLPARGGLPPRPQQGAPPGAPPAGLPVPPLPRIGATAITPLTVAQVVQARAVAAGFGLRELGGHSLKRGALPSRIGPVEFGMLGRMVALRCPEDFVPILLRAGAAWEPGSRRWLIERWRIRPVIRALQRETDPLFRWAGLAVD